MKENETLKKYDAAFEAYFKKVCADLKAGNRPQDHSIQDCAGSWIEKADFTRMNQ